MTTWNDRLAALRVVEAGLKAALDIAKEEALKESLEMYQSHRVKQWETPFGDMRLEPGDPKAYVKDIAGFVEYARTWLGPESVETVTRVAGWADKQIMDRLTVEVPVSGTGGDNGEAVVVDSQTGEVVDWAGVKPATPYMSLPSSKESKRAKGQAVDWVLAQLDALPKQLES